MKPVYLPSARDDIVWLRLYYSQIFPAGHVRAREAIRAAETLLRQFPYAGRVTEFADVREIMVSHTPFSMIYRLTPDRIEVLRVWDNRRPFETRD